MIQEVSLTRDDCLPLSLWAYRTTKSTTTKRTPFSLVYGAKAILLAEIKVPSATMLLSTNQDNNSKIFDLETIEGKREEAQKNL